MLASSNRQRCSLRRKTGIPACQSAHGKQASLPVNPRNRERIHQTGKNAGPESVYVSARPGKDLSMSFQALDSGGKRYRLNSWPRLRPVSRATAAKRAGARGDAMESGVFSKE